MFPFLFPTTAEGWQNVTLAFTVIALTIAFAIGATNIALSWKVNRLKKEESRKKDEQLASDLKDKDVLIAAADKRAAEANVEAARANESAANLNKRAQTMEHDNLVLRDDLNKATGEVAKLQKAAADARAAQQKVETQLAKQQVRAASAERALLELQARIQPRRLIPEQSAALLELLKASPKGAIDVTCMHGDAESCALAAQIVAVLREADWQIDSFDSPIAMGVNPTPFEGVEVYAHNKNNLPAHANALFQSLNEIGLATWGAKSKNADDGKVYLTVGVKPLEQRPRIITAQQRATFLRLAQGFQKGQIQIIGVVTDLEAMAFATQLTDLLRAGGWIVNDKKDDTLTYGPVGLTLFSKKNEQQLPSDSPLAHFLQLTNLLKGIGFNTRTKSNPNLADLDVLLVVGPNLDPRMAQ